MKKTLTVAAAAMMFATLAGASAFTEGRNPEGTWRDDQVRGEEARAYHRDDDRVTAEGRITRVIRERGGFRIELDRGRDSYWVPEGRLGGRDLSIGLAVRIRGIFRGDIVVVDDLGYPDGGYAYGDGRDYRDYRDREVRGIIDRVNYRLGYLILRERDGDVIKVDMRPVNRARREPDIDDLRRGDAIAISGDWTRDGLFRAERIDRIRR